VGGTCFAFISFTSRELPSPRATMKASQRNPSRPYGSSSLLPIFIAQVDAYP
jgi:hypothetical protein